MPYNLEPLTALGNVGVQAQAQPLANYMNVGNAINTQVQRGFDSDVKTRFANKVQQAINSIPVYITDEKTGESVQNPAYVSALKPLALEAYHAQVQTGDNTLMDDLNSLIKTQQTATGRGTIDWGMAQQIEQQYNTFRTKLESLQESKNTLDEAGKTEYNDLYNQYVALDSQYSQATQGKRLPFKGRTDQYNATNQRISEANAKKAEFGVDQMRDKATQDAIAYADKSADTWLNQKAEFIKKVAEVKKAKLLAESIETNGAPETLFAIVKALAGIIEPGLAVTEGEVNGFLGKNSVQNAMAMVSNLKSMADMWKPGAKVESLAYEAGNGNATAVAQIKEMARTLGSALGAYWDTVITSGSGNFKESVNDAIKLQFKRTIDENDLAQIGALFEKKFNSRMPSSAESSNIPLAPKQEPISPNDYSFQGLPNQVQKLGTRTETRDAYAKWLSDSLAIYNSIPKTDNKHLSDVLRVIKQEYKLAENAYDMPTEIDTQIKALDSMPMTPKVEVVQSKKQTEKPKPKTSDSKIINTGKVRM